MALEGFELPTSRMYNKLAAFTNTAGSDPYVQKRCRYVIQSTTIVEPNTNTRITMLDIFLFSENVH